MLVNKLNQLKQPVKTLACFRRNENNRCVGHERKIVHQLFPIRIHRSAVLFESVPLVDSDNTGFTHLMRNTGDLRILLGKALDRINHDNTDICPLNSHFGSDNAVFFDLIVHSAFSSEPGGINKQKFTGFVRDIGVGRISCGAGNIRDNGSFLAGNLIDKRRFSDIRLSDDGNFDHVVVLFGLLRIGKKSEHFIKQIARAVTVNSRNSNRVT